MKKLIIILIFIIFSKVCSEEKQNQDSLNFNRNAFFIEIIGNSVSLFCLNYEYNFLSNDSKFSILSMRVGFGSGAFFVPPGIITMVDWNYGLSHKFEFGVGIIYTLGDDENKWEPTIFTGTKSNVINTITMGYKYVNFKDEWLFRIGYTPRMSIEGIVWHSIGLSYGWTW